MLAEFALTPSLFDQTAQPDVEAWREQLRELGSNMFPKTAAWPVMVSDLYGGSWENVALRTIEGIDDSKARVLCADILRNASNTLVSRPAKGEWPGEDIDSWVREAVASHAEEPIDRIIACPPAKVVLAAEGCFIRGLDEVEDAGFWKDVEASWSQSMRIDDQVASLRKFCIHSDFLCLISPHIRGALDDETSFACELIRSAFRRPSGYLPAEVEIHTEGPDNKAANYSTHLENVAANVSRLLSGALGPGQKVKVFLWPRLLDRYLIAGQYSEMSDESSARKARWGVAMQHIARRGDAWNETPPTSWSLLKKPALYDVFERHCKTGVLGFSHAFEVVG